MAYRVKGILTKKQRDIALASVRSYFALVNNEDTSETLRTLVEDVFRLWVMLCMFVLYMDEVKMLQKAVGAVDE